MAVHTEYGQPVSYVGPIGRALRALVVVVVFFAFATAAAIGGFEYGVASRPGDAEITARQQAAIHTAVRRAVAAKGAADHAQRLRIMARAAARQRTRFATTLEKRLIAQQVADSRNAARAFSRGRAAVRGGKAANGPKH